MVRGLNIILLVVGVLLAGSESEYFISNITGLAMVYTAGYKLKPYHE